MLTENEALLSDSEEVHEPVCICPGQVYMY